MLFVNFHEEFGIFLEIGRVWWGGEDNRLNQSATREWIFPKLVQFKLLGSGKIFQ